MKDIIRRVQIAADPIASLYFYATVPIVIGFIWLIGTIIFGGDICK